MKFINKMRTTGDKRGGILTSWKNNFINIKEIESSHVEILVVKFTVGKYLFNMIVVYLIMMTTEVKLLIKKYQKLWKSLTIKRCFRSETSTYYL